MLMLLTGAVVVACTVWLDFLSSLSFDDREHYARQQNTAGHNLSQPRDGLAKHPSEYSLLLNVHAAVSPSMAKCSEILNVLPLAESNERRRSKNAKPQLNVIAPLFL